MSNLITSLSAQLTTLISDECVDKAKKMINQYSDKTTSMVITESLYQLRNMLKKIKSMDLVNESIEFDLVKKELKKRVCELNRLVVRACGKRPCPKLSDTDIELRQDIIIKYKTLFGKPSELYGVVTFLLEVKHDS